MKSIHIYLNFVEDQKSLGYLVLKDINFDILNNLIEQLSLGNKNPGIVTKKLFKDIYELRGKNHARVYYREVQGRIKILAKSIKTNQDKVIKTLERLYSYYNLIKE